MKRFGWFDGKEARVVISDGLINVYYGGISMPDGPGHGHVKAVGAIGDEFITYWRLPDSEGGGTIVDDDFSILHLRSHLTALF